MASTSARSLAFGAAAVSFDISEAEGAGTGTAEGALSVTNTTETGVVLKVKTNAAERYLVHPHILLLAPGERRRVSVDLPPGRYRLRTLHPGETVDIEHEGGPFPGLRVTASGV
jgi:hypothetical protein